MTAEAWCAYSAKFHAAMWGSGAAQSAQWLDVDLVTGNPAGVDIPVAAADPVAWWDATSVHISYRTPEGPLCDLVPGNGGWQPLRIPSAP